MNVIEVRDLTKAYGDGKSTTVEILEGHRTRTSGDVAVLGHDPARAGRAFRDRIGIVLQSSGVEHELSVREAVTIYGSAYSSRRPVGEVVELVGLTPQLDTRVGVLAAGRLVAEGTPEELIGGSGTTVVRFDLPAGTSPGDLGRVLPPDAVIG